MKSLLSLLLLYVSFSISAQTLSLKSCIDSAMANYPLSKQAEINTLILQSELQNIKNANLPQIDITGRATYQNEVISLPIQIPGIVIPDAAKDQYKVQLEINQMIYKGGLTKAQNELSQSNEAINNAQMEVQLNDVKRSVIGIYYQILLDNDLIEISTTFANTLLAKQNEIISYVKAGAMLESSSDLIKVEQLGIEQKILELEINKKALINQLQNITGLKINPEAKFEMPKFDAVNDSAQQRPEFRLMELNQQKIDVLKKISSAQSMPKAMAFSTIGYGRPGFNMLSNDFAPYALFGLGFNYTLLNWGKFAEEKKILDLNKNLIETQKESFLMNLSLNLIELRSQIETQLGLLTKAEEIVSLRKNVLETTDNQLKNGVVNSSQYIDDLQKYEKAKLDAQVYKIKLLIAQTNYLWALGRL